MSHSTHHECPNGADSINPGMIACAILQSIGHDAVVGPEMVNYPCGKCTAGWVDGVPPALDDKTTWPKHLLVIDRMFGGPASNGVQRTPNPRGLGDTIAIGLAAIGVRKRKGCGCGKRQAWLNRLVPYAN